MKKGRKVSICSLLGGAEIQCRESTPLLISQLIKELGKLDSEIQQQLRNERKLLTFIDARVELSLASERRDL